MAKLRLGEVLKEKGISKRKFAKMINYHYNAVFRFFRKTYDPKLSRLTEWAEALECSVCDLIEEKPRRNKRKENLKTQ